MEFRPYYLAREWTDAGHVVKIIAGSFSHIRANQPAILEAGEFSEKIDGIDYLWYKTPSYSGNGFGRVISILSFIGRLWFNARDIALNFKPDVVIASSTYPVDIWAAKKIASVAKAKLVYEVHDLWPLSPIELGGMSRWHPFIIWVQLAEDYAYKHADNVVSMLPNSLDYMVSRGMSQEKWTYVPNGVNQSEWQSPDALPHDVQVVLDKMKARHLPIVCYAGTHGLANALDVLLDAASLLDGRVQILCVGKGPERERLYQRVLSEDLRNVVMLTSVPKASMPNLLAQIDIAYIGWHHNPLYRFGISPNKLMDYMMAGRPIVHSVDAGNDPVEEVGCGLTVNPNDPGAVAKAIDELCDLSAEELMVLGAKGREFVMLNRSYSKLAKNFLVAIEQKLNA